MTNECAACFNQLLSLVSVQFVHMRCGLNLNINIINIIYIVHLYNNNEYHIIVPMLPIHRESIDV